MVSPLCYFLPLPAMIILKPTPDICTTPKTKKHCKVSQGTIKKDD